jgi:hypothetical protein
MILKSRSHVGFAFLFMAFLLPNPCRAEMDAATRTALEQTQALLKDPAALEKLMSGDAGARKADQSARGLTGGGVEHRELYEIASEIFGSLVTNSGGDPAALQSLLSEAEKSPEKLYSKLSPAQQSRIKGLAAKIEGSMAKGTGGSAIKRP